MVPDHGGRLNRAAAAYGIPLEHWLDLSTGINPWPWPVPEVPGSVWQRLPEADDDLPAIARAWAGAPAAAGCVTTAGSQAVIQALPRLRAPCRVGVPAPGYAEHAWWWRQQGHAVINVPHDDVDAHLDHLDVLVWIHPNNPTGLTVPTERLLEWHRRLQARDGWLVVDEAFIDPTPADSVAPATGPDGLLVMRSLGKFFGLAGLRGGFLFGPAPLCDHLDTLLGPWAVSHPARWVMRQALADRAWQEANRRRLDAGAAALDQVLRRHGLTPAGGTSLFRYCPHGESAALQDRLAREGILVRLFQGPAALRFGLAPDEAGLARLDTALSI
ncbi:threonine-phosphate decarboxylase CobD [Aquisalimonas asiatica]|uniref:threonine-phosphate decarboxylase n=1 Tax=Aquisalimonas asiatica TaxID=406100 RepID=A0A1H8UF08_9GAMM|nr:threonine-phosphate decarboxylase CobD [Aquisalimonas asiatica]SEP01686.1 L-threonine O-3-phosphate decarboxylase [Aquisalimonas asiatica]